MLDLPARRVVTCGDFFAPDGDANTCVAPASCQLMRGPRAVLRRRLHERRRRVPRRIERDLHALPDDGGDPITITRSWNAFAEGDITRVFLVILSGDRSSPAGTP